MKMFSVQVTTVAPPGLRGADFADGLGMKCCHLTNQDNMSACGHCDMLAAADTNEKSRTRSVFSVMFEMQPTKPKEYLYCVLLLTSMAPPSGNNTRTASASTVNPQSNARIRLSPNWETCDEL